MFKTYSKIKKIDYKINIILFIHIILLCISLIWFIYFIIIIINA